MSITSYTFVSIICMFCFFFMFFILAPEKPNECYHRLMPRVTVWTWIFAHLFWQLLFLISTTLRFSFDLLFISDTSLIAILSSSEFYRIHYGDPNFTLELNRQIPIFCMTMNQRSGMTQAITLLSLLVWIQLKAQVTRSRIFSE